MNTIKLSIRGGGLTGFSKYRKPESKSWLEKEWDKALKNDRKFIVLRETALRGIIHYLIGDTAKISTLSNKDVDAAIKTKKVVSSKATFSMLSTRYKHSNAKNPSVNIRHLSLGDTQLSMSLSEKEIVKAFGTDNLSQIYDYINKNDKSTFVTVGDLIKIKQLYNLIDKNIIPNISNPKGKFWRKTSDRLIEFYNDCFIKVNSGEKVVFAHKTKVSKGFFTDKTVAVYELIVSRAISDLEYLQKMNVASTQFLCNTPKSKDWVPSTKVKYLTSGVDFLLKMDMEVYLDISDELLQKMIQGPGSAFWAHNGMVEWNIVAKDEIPEYTEMEACYVIPKTQKEKKEGKI